MELRRDPPRLAAYIREAIAEPALGRDLAAAHDIRKPALLRQVLGYALASPARVVSLQKLRGDLDDAGALAEFLSRYPAFEPRLLVSRSQLNSTERISRAAGFRVQAWEEFLLEGPR